MKTRNVSLRRKVAPCPVCGTPSKKHSEGVRRPREIGLGEPTILNIYISKHYCVKCRKHFSQDTTHLAPKGYKCTARVVRTALQLLKDGQTLERASNHMWSRYHVKVPTTTLHEWSVKEVAV